MRFVYNVPNDALKPVHGCLQPKLEFPGGIERIIQLQFALNFCAPYGKFDERMNFFTRRVASVWNNLPERLIPSEN